MTFRVMDLGFGKKMDRISSLPDEIICNILSFLLIKEAALTSVLSKRWRNLFAFTPNLHLDVQEVGREQSFGDFVDSILAVSRNFPLKKFSIKCRESINSAHVTRWIRNVLKHNGVSNLDIDITAASYIIVPFEIFTCKTMVELKLASRLYAMLPENVSLPSLKTLFLDSFWFCNIHYCALGKLLSACPVLEELTIRGADWQNRRCCRNMTSSTLKRLTIMCGDTINFWNMSFNTPSVAYLEYSDLVPKEYPTVNLESLVEAKLNLRVSRGYSNPTNLIKGLRNVEILELSSMDTSEMFYYFREAIPVFKNLFRLSITTALASCWVFLPILLKKSPNLHTLVIQGPLHVQHEGEYGFVCGCLSGYACLLSCPVKILKINEYVGTDGELEQMKHFVEKFSCLELVEVRASVIKDNERSRVQKDLLMLTRPSKCKIQIKFIN